jgi:hypothetical protein
MLLVALLRQQPKVKKSTGNGQALVKLLELFAGNDEGARGANRRSM